MYTGVGVRRVLGQLRVRLLVLKRGRSVELAGGLPSGPILSGLSRTILYVYFGKGGGLGEVREKVEGQQFTRGVENTHMTDCISSL